MNFVQGIGTIGLCMAVSACQTTTETTANTATESASAVVIASTAEAASICAKRPISHRWAVRNGDQRFTAETLAARVKGKTLTSASGSKEQYKRDGSYAFVLGDQVFNAPGYAIYADGSRCIAYDNPRYDMYVMSGGELVLINQQGGRFPTK